MGNSTLIAFYSLTKDFSFGNNVRVVKGHTEQVADQIAGRIGDTDMYRISRIEALMPERAYTPRPLENMRQYRILFLGFPIYYHTMPSEVKEFLRSYDFSGMTIIPFTTHAGSGLGRSVEEIRAMCPDSEVLPGLAVGSAEVLSAKDKIRKWVEESCAKAGRSC